jgi:hypothetical protein
MAIVIRGKSVCHLCGNVIEPSDAILLFPPALFDPCSALAHLNDSGVHRRCIEESPDYDDARRALENYVARLRASEPS